MTQPDPTDPRAPQIRRVARLPGPDSAFSAARPVHPRAVPAPPSTFIEVNSHRMLAEAGIATYAGIRLQKSVLLSDASPARGPAPVLHLELDTFRGELELDIPLWHLGADSAGLMALMRLLGIIALEQAPGKPVYVLQSKLGSGVVASKTSRSDLVMGLASADLEHVIVLS